MVRSILTGYDLLLNWIVDPALESFADHLFWIVQSSGGTLTAKVTPETLARIFQELSHEYTRSSENLVASQGIKALRLKQILCVDSAEVANSSSSNGEPLLEDELITIELEYANRHEIPIVCFNVEKYEALARSANLSIDIWNVLEIRRAHETYLRLIDLVHPTSPLFSEVNSEVSRSEETTLEEEKLPDTKGDVIHFAETIDFSNLPIDPEAPEARSRTEDSTPIDEHRSRQVYNISQEGRVEPTPRRFDSGSDLIQMLFLLLTQALLTYLLQQGRNENFNQSELATVDQGAIDDLSNLLKNLSGISSVEAREAAPSIDLHFNSQSSTVADSGSATGSIDQSIIIPLQANPSEEAQGLNRTPSSSEWLTVEVNRSGNNLNQVNGSASRSSDDFSRGLDGDSVVKKNLLPPQGFAPIDSPFNPGQIRNNQGTSDNKGGNNPNPTIDLPDIDWVPTEQFDPQKPIQPVVSPIDRNPVDPNPADRDPVDQDPVDRNPVDRNPVEQPEEPVQPQLQPNPGSDPGANPGSGQESEDPGIAPSDPFTPISDPNPVSTPTPNPAPPPIVTPTPDPIPVEQPKLTTLSNPTGTTIFDISSSGCYVIEHFGGIGRGVTPSQETLDSLDVLKFTGEELTAENLLLEQQGDNLLIRFTIANSPEVRLKDFRLDNIDNLSAHTWASVTAGNILFNDQASIEDAFDVIDAELQLKQVLRPNTVTFLNSLDNQTLGYEEANDVINGQDGNDHLTGLSGDDILRGEAGNDRLDGNEGDDILIGGTGNDTLVGGAGSDRFVLSASGSAMILDFQLGLDRLELEGNIPLDQVSVQIIGNDTVLFLNQQPFATFLGIQVDRSTLLGDQFSS